MPSAQRADRAVIVSRILFLFGSVLSIYMGVLAKSVALYYASFKTDAAISLTGTFISLQMLGVAVAALAAILILAEGFLKRRDGV
jgi:hypothetical protein